MFNKIKALNFCQRCHQYKSYFQSQLLMEVHLLVFIYNVRTQYQIYQNMNNEIKKKYVVSLNSEMLFYSSLNISVVDNNSLLEPTQYN